MGHPVVPQTSLLHKNTSYLSSSGEEEAEVPHEKLLKYLLVDFFFSP